MVTNTELAAYFQVAPEILPFVPQLLQDFEELGSDPGLVVEWLRDEGLQGPGVRVLDLGCGKGAVALAVAGSLGCRVDGVDAMPAFVDEARRLAGERTVSALCTFECGDLRETVARARGYDAVLLVSVGVLGSPAAMIAGCRQCVAPGGLMILEDGYRLTSAAVDHPGYQDMATLEETLEQLTAHGDRLLREQRTTLEEMRAQNRRYTAWIAARVGELADRHPEHAAAFHAYLERERRECEILESSVECATWLLRRAPSDGGR